MTIRVKITNEDSDPTRGIFIIRNEQVVAQLMPGQSTDQHVWLSSPLTIQEFHCVTGKAT